MGNFLSNLKRKQLLLALNSRSSRNSSRERRSGNYPFPVVMSVPQASSFEGGGSASTGQINDDNNNNKVSKLQRKQSAKQKYGFIPDNFSTLEQVLFFFFLL